MRHCKNFHDSGKLAGSKRKPSENAEWLLGEIVHSRKRFKHESIQTNSDTTKSRFTALGTTTCSTCFRQLYAIGKTSYHRALLAITNTTADNKRPNALATRETLSSVCKRSHAEDVTKTVLRQYCDKLASDCEAMPSQLEVGNLEGALFDLDEMSHIHHNETRFYPACYTYSSMFVDYQEHAVALHNGEFPPVQYDHFRNTLKLLYPTCKLLPKNSVMFKCIKCAKLRADFDGASDQRVKLLCLHYMKKHKHRFQRGRQHYANNISYCLAQPATAMSQIVDGMDQNKCRCPRIPNNRSDTPTECQTKFHVIGSLVHGVKMFAFCLVSSKWAQAGPQMTVTVILKTIRRCVNIHGFLPPDYYLQLDNPSGENKNHDVFSFLGNLVEWDVYNTVYLSFGITGHTHFDIDQAFSRLSVALSKGHITPDQFFERIRTGFSHMGTPTEVIPCNELVNWHLASATHTNEFTGISKPMLFKFTNDANGDTVVYYKAHYDKLTWKGGVKVFHTRLSPEATCAHDWPFVPLDGKVLKENIRKLEPYVSQGISHGDRIHSNSCLG
jgi:hypothetical protein